MDTPIEVIEQIVDHLRPEGSSTSEVPTLDKSDLRSCSLVSKAWLAVSTPMLFRDIGYNFVVGEQAATDESRTLKMISSFFRDRADIAAHIEKLWIGQRIGDRVSEGDEFALEELQELLPHLTHLRELNLVNPIITHALNPPQFPPKAMRTTLKSLHITYRHRLGEERGSLNGTVNVTNILYHFSAIETLSLVYTPWWKKMDLQASLPAPPTIQNIILHGIPTHDSDLLDRVNLGLPRMVEIEAVQVLYLASDTWGSHVGVLRLFASSLERLWMLPYPWFDYLRHNRRSKVLTSFKMLKQVAFPLTLNYSDDDADQPKWDLEELDLALRSAGLTKNQHTELEEIVLLITPYTIYSAKELTGLQNALDATLVEVVRQHNLGKVVFVWCRPDRHDDTTEFSDADLEDYMERLFPLLHENRMIEFRGDFTFWRLSRR